MDGRVDGMDGPCGWLVFSPDAFAGSLLFCFCLLIIVFYGFFVVFFLFIPLTIINRNLQIYVIDP